MSATALRNGSTEPAKAAEHPPLPQQGAGDGPAANGNGVKAVYFPGVFDVATVDDAKRIILGPEDDRTTDERWKLETPYLMDLIAQNMQLTHESVVIDYGCGIGRMSKELIARHGCRVIGVDISASMRAHAERYVGSVKFSTCSPEDLYQFGTGFADAALSIWVLQHCPKVDDDIARLRRALKAAGQLLIVNEKESRIPTNLGWVADSVDLRKLLVSKFDPDMEERLDPEVVTAVVADRTFWGIYKNRSEAALPEAGATPASNAEISDQASAPAPGARKASESAAQSAPKRPYPAPAEVPTQLGPEGIRYDFNDGCRVVLPEGERPWRIRLSDIDTGNILFEAPLKGGRVNSTKRYFVRIRLEVWLQDKNVLTHDYAAADREVLVQFPVGTIGDTVGWLPYAVKFKEKHKCRLTCGLGEKLIPLFRDAYPDINFVPHEEIKPENYYATYSMGLFFDDKDCVHQPCDFRHVGLHRTAGYILGVDPTEVPPKIAVSDDERPIKEPYVCIAVQSSTQAKYWNNPNGWREVVRFLKEHGYRVVCIDQKPSHGIGLVWNHIPNGAEDETGDRPLEERARWLKHADFCVGLSSGLSWLAWAAGTPVVMISGFTHPLNEFATPYRVVNYHTCNSCWNDPRVRFDHKDFLWCPRHKDTPRQFECTRLITTEQVKSAIRGIPGFGKLSESEGAVQQRKTGRKSG